MEKIEEKARVKLGLGKLQRMSGFERYMHFVEKPDKCNECWKWHGTTDIQGYGHLRVDGRKTLAHRYSYQLHLGDFDQSLYVLHKCDNPNCTNPMHLFLGTHMDNMVDMIKKNRAWHSTEERKIFFAKNRTGLKTKATQ